MKRLILMLVLLGIAAPAYSGCPSGFKCGNSWGDQQRSKYLRSMANDGWFGLAMTPDGCWSYGAGTPPYIKEVIRVCKRHCSSGPCEVADVAGKSDFIKKRLTANPASTIWCAAKGYSKVYRWSRSDCQGRGGKDFTTQSAANSEMSRITSASSSSSNQIWCTTQTIPPFKTSKASCKDQGGYSYQDRAKAQENHDYLKGGTTSTASAGASSGSASTTTPTVPDKPKLARLTVKSNPTNANVYINNVYKGRTVLTVEGSPGYYSIRVEKDGYNPFQQGVQLKNDADVWASLTKKEVAKPKPEPQPQPSTSSTPRLAGTGTGFAVNTKYVVTADHVVDGCGSVTIRHSHMDYRTRVVARDSRNDLGLLRVDGTLTGFAKLRGGKGVRNGEAIATYGYPLYGELSDSAKITRGDINSLAGPGNNSGEFQYSAPSQPGNSGGPILDFSAHVVGVVSAGLSKKYADQSGHIAQNVNFAVKSYLVEGFLSSNNVSFEKAESTEKLELPDIAEKAEKFTVLVGCWE